MINKTKLFFPLLLLAVSPIFSAAAVSAAGVTMQAGSFSVTQVITTTDPGFTLNGQDIDKQWALVDAGFIPAWSQTTGTTSNVVALIDTGVDATHQDLQNINFVPGYDFIHNAPIIGRVNSDDNGHGTLIAGILGATPNNGIGIVGTNWKISIMPLKVLDSTGTGDSSTIAKAIVWAVDHGAQFINLSLGGTGFGSDTTLSNAITYAFNKGAVIVAAAGNDSVSSGSDLDTSPVFPVCDDNGSNMIIGVVALDQNNVKTNFSNYGKNCIDVSAPGKRILSTINYDPATKATAPNSYAYASGTSLAVPFVVGEAALIKTLYPQATNIQIRDRRISSTDPIDNLNLGQCGGGPCAGMLGTGEIDAAKALSSQISIQSILDGDLVKDNPQGPVYEISGGQKLTVSPFVMNQKFMNQVVKTVLPTDLAKFPNGPYAAPTDGTLIQAIPDNTIYMVSQGLKLPITYQVFLQRELNFSDVQIVSYPEMSSWTSGNLLPPSDGTLVKTIKNPTIYLTQGGVLHPIDYNFFLNHKLNLDPILVVSNSDLTRFSKGSSYTE